MFWDSVWGGLALLSHWQVWLVLILYAGTLLGFQFGVGAMMAGEESGARMGAGCLTMAIGGPIVEGIATSFAVIFLVPLMLGGDSLMPFSVFLELLWPAVKAGLTAMAIVFVLSIIPGIGHIVGELPGVSGFLQGVIVFRIFSSTFLEEIILESVPGSADIYPGFFHSVGYLVIALVVVWVVMALISIPMEINRRKNRNDIQVMLEKSFGQAPDETAVSAVIGIVFVRLLGLLPVFMYASYTALSVQRLLGY